MKNKGLGAPKPRANHTIQQSISRQFHQLILQSIAFLLHEQADLGKDEVPHEPKDEQDHLL